MRLPFSLDCTPPFLILRFEDVHQSLGWSITKPGFQRVQEIVWLEVHDADLPLHVDPLVFLQSRLASKGLDGAAAFMTARDVRRHHIARAHVGKVVATCVTTVGLSNGERVGSRRLGNARSLGTINTLVHVSHPLSEGAFVEAVSIATQARTTAILEASYFREGQAITGTGTDCVIVAAPPGDAPETCAGLHTEVGEAIGCAVLEATRQGAEAWSLDTGAKATGQSATPGLRLRK